MASSDAAIGVSISRRWDETRSRDRRRQEGFDLVVNEPPPQKPTVCRLKELLRDVLDAAVVALVVTPSLRVEPWFTLMYNDRVNHPCEPVLKLYPDATPAVGDRGP